MRCYVSGGERLPPQVDDSDNVTGVSLFVAVGVTMTATEITIGINGMAHVILTVSQFAAARAFYGRLLPALGMTPVCDTDELFYCVGARTAIGIQPAGPAHDGDRFVQSRGWIAPSMPASPFARRRRSLA